MLTATLTDPGWPYLVIMTAASPGLDPICFKGALQLNIDLPWAPEYFWSNKCSWPPGPCAELVFIIRRTISTEQMLNRYQIIRVIGIQRIGLASRRSTTRRLYLPIHISGFLCISLQWLYLVFFGHQIKRKVGALAHLGHLFIYEELQIITLFIVQILRQLLNFLL